MMQRVILLAAFVTSVFYFGTGDASGGEPRHIRAHKGAVNELAFLPDGDKLASVSSDGAVKLWSLTSGRLEAKETHEDAVITLAVDPTGDHLITSAKDGSALLRSAETLGLQQRLVGAVGAVNGLSFADSGERVFGAAADGSCMAWTYPGLFMDRVFKTGEQSTTGVANLHGRGEIAVAGAETIYFFDVSANADREQQHSVRAVKTSLPLITDLCASDDGQVLAAASINGEIFLQSFIDEDAGQTLKGQTLKGHDAPIADLCFASDVQWMASVDDAGKIALWNLEAKTAAHLQWDAPLVSAAFSPDNKLLATGDINGVIALWYLPGGGQCIGYVGDSKDEINYVELVYYRYTDSQTDYTLTFALTEDHPAPKRCEKVEAPKFHAEVIARTESGLSPTVVRRRDPKEKLEQIAQARATLRQQREARERVKQQQAMMQAYYTSVMRSQRYRGVRGVRYGFANRASRPSYGYTYSPRTVTTYVPRTTTTTTYTYTYSQ